MAATYDLVIRGGTVVDGSGGELAGGELAEADVAVLDGRIAAVGRIAGSGREEIDARGRIVTPGFVDIHTHYDGQATWEQRMQPSSWHGVTTVIGGNCGVGFAPCRPGDREKLIKLMEGVEDVPEVVMTTGIPWTWETFPEYLDLLASQQYDIDVGVQIPHSPVRVYVMGQRGADREPATADDIERMGAIVAEGVRAGAFGVSTSRSVAHRTKAGEHAPSFEAADRELMGLARGLAQASAGVFQLIPAVLGDPNQEYAVMQKIVEASGRPLSFTLQANHKRPDIWRTYLDLMESGQLATAPIRGQVYPRPVGVLYGLDLSLHPFSLNPSFRPLADLPLAAKVAEMRKPEVRARLLAEEPQDVNPFTLTLVRMERSYYLMGDPPCYTPAAADELGQVAVRRGLSKAEVVYDALLQDEGRAILYCPTNNYAGNTLDAAGQMLRNPNTVIGLGDGGAHYGLICDASYPTFLLTHWVRDARPGAGLGLSEAVKALTTDTATAMGLTDRGRIAVGLKADLNVIDLDGLTLGAPAPVYDLPNGARRLRQRASGFTATVVAGEVTYRDGEATGALPGRLLRRGAT